MRMKKVTGISILAVAFAAILGVATVSYAKWSGGEATVTANAATAVIDMYGFSQKTPLNAADYTGKSIVPFDQDTTDANHVTVYAIQLPSYVVSGDYTITVANSANLPFYAKFGDAKEDTPTSTSGWDALFTQEGNVITAGSKEYKVTTAPANVSGKWVNIVLDSSNIEHMAKDVKFTVTLAV